MAIPGSPFVNKLNLLNFNKYLLVHIYSKMIYNFDIPFYKQCYLLFRRGYPCTRAKGLTTI